MVGKTWWKKEENRRKYKDLGSEGKRANREDRFDENEEERRKREKKGEAIETTSGINEYGEKIKIK